MPDFDFQLTVREHALSQMQWAGLVSLCSNHRGSVVNIRWE
jgi:hypothetical protein